MLISGQSNLIAMLRTRSVILVVALIVAGLVCNIFIRNIQLSAYSGNSDLIFAKKVAKVPRGHVLRHAKFDDSATTENKQVKVTHHSLREMKNRKLDAESTKQEVKVSRHDLSKMRNKKLDAESTKQEVKVSRHDLSGMRNKKLDAESTKQEVKVSRHDLSEMRNKKLDAESTKQEVKVSRHDLSEMRNKKLDAESTKQEVKVNRHGLGETRNKKLDAESTKQEVQVTRHSLGLLPNKKLVAESTNFDMGPLAGDNKILNVVYFLWCEKKIFSFRHYLSVLSVQKYLQPDQIMFYYAHRPRIDQYDYNAWFGELYNKPFFRSEARNDAKEYCKSKTQKMKFIKKMLSPSGGIYVHENTIFTSYPSVYMKANSVNGINRDLKGFFAADETYMKDSNMRGAVNIKTLCVPEYKLTKHQIHANITCLIETRDIYPRDLWDQTDDYSKHLRMLFYGKKPLKPSPSSNGLVPNIAHMFYAGGGAMDYVFYLGCLSFIYVVKVDKLYIHGDTEPSGVYWKKIKRQPKLQFIRRVLPQFIYSQNTRIYNHMSDIFRADVLRKYGGIYSDTDVIWTKPLPDWVRRYDAVASYDWPAMYPTYPDYVNFGVSFGKKNAPFWRLFLQSMKKFRDDLFGYNGLLRVYKVYERNPHLLYLYDRLQVMCWEMRCHPTWFPNWRMLNSSHLNGPKLRWDDAHSFHWTAPTPTELHNETILLKSTGLWADIGKNVLRKAGIIN